MPINFWREKEHPKIKADGEYPAWLWSAQRPSLAVLNRKIASEGLRSLTLEELRRWRKLATRNSIKAANRQASEGQF